MLRESIVNDVQHALDQCNPYDQRYRMVREQVLQNLMHTVKLKLYGKRGHTTRLTILIPTTSEVVGLNVGDYDAAS